MSATTIVLFGITWGAIIAGALYLRWFSKAAIDESGSEIRSTIRDVRGEVRKLGELGQETARRGCQNREEIVDIKISHDHHYAKTCELRRRFGAMLKAARLPETDE